MNKLNKIKIHFVGIGGIGMSGIAELMFDLGYTVQGSDINTNANNNTRMNANPPTLRVMGRQAVRTVPLPGSLPGDTVSGASCSLSVGIRSNRTAPLPPRADIREYPGEPRLPAFRRPQAHFAVWNRTC